MCIIKVRGEMFKTMFKAYDRWTTLTLERRESDDDRVMLLRGVAPNQSAELALSLPRVAATRVWNAARDLIRATAHVAMAYRPYSRRAESPCVYVLAQDDAVASAVRSEMRDALQRLAHEDTALREADVLLRDALRRVGVTGDTASNWLYPRDVEIRGAPWLL